MENDYRITKLHGTFIGDNRIPDLPVGEKTKILSSTNGKTGWVDLPEGGKSVPPVLVLMDDNGVRTSLTEEEKTNLENWMYSSVYFIDETLGENAVYSTYFPELLLGKSNMFLMYNATASNEGLIATSGISYEISLGEKNADGNYPLTITKTAEVPVAIGAGGGGNSLTLKLTDLSAGEQKTSLTEEEKTNLEAGRYGFISYYDPSWGDAGEYMAIFPQLLACFQGSYFALIYNISTVVNGVPLVSGLLGYSIEIGEKNSDGMYPLTIEKAVEMPFAGGGGGTVEVITATKTSDQEIEEAGLTAIKLDKVPTSSQFILSYDNESLLMYKDADGQYSGASFVSLYSAGLSCAFVTVDSSGNAIGAFRKYDLSFLNDMKRENVGKVLTIESTGHAFFEMPTIPGFKHTVTIKTSAGAILWTQTLFNSKNTPVDSYDDLHTLFGGELLAGYGEYCQLDLRGGTEATDKLIKADGTEATLESLGAIVYTDVCFLPK